MFSAVASTFVFNIQDGVGQDSQRINYHLLKIVLALFRGGLVATARNTDSGGMVHDLRVGDGQLVRYYFSPDSRPPLLVIPSMFRMPLATPTLSRTSFDVVNELPPSCCHDIRLNQ